MRARAQALGGRTKEGVRRPQSTSKPGRLRRIFIEPRDPPPCPAPQGGRDALQGVRRFDRLPWVSPPSRRPRLSGRRIAHPAPTRRPRSLARRRSGAVGSSSIRTAAPEAATTTAAPARDVRWSRTSLARRSTLSASADSTRRSGRGTAEQERPPQAQPPRTGPQLSSSQASAKTSSRHSPPSPVCHNGGREQYVSKAAERSGRGRGSRPRREGDEEP